MTNSLAYSCPPPLGNSQNRTNYKLACETVPENCAGLIQFDGWEIKDDYPFKY